MLSWGRKFGLEMLYEPVTYMMKVTGSDNVCCHGSAWCTNFWVNIYEMTSHFRVLAVCRSRILFQIFDILNTIGLVQKQSTNIYLVTF